MQMSLFALKYSSNLGIRYRLHPHIVRAGVLLSLAPPIVVRGGYSHVIGYFDTAASRSLEVGIGYRF